MNHGHLGSSRPVHAFSTQALTLPAIDLPSILNLLLDCYLLVLTFHVHQPSTRDQALARILFISAGSLNKSTCFIIFISAFIYFFCILYLGIYVPTGNSSW